VELPNLTEALYLARERAMDSMQQMGLGLHADGVVNVKLREVRSGTTRASSSSWRSGPRSSSLTAATARLSR